MENFFLLKVAGRNVVAVKISERTVFLDIFRSFSVTQVKRNLTLDLR